MKSDVCEGLFKSAKFVIKLTEKGVHHIEGRAGDEIVRTYEVSNASQVGKDPGAHMLHTKGVQYGEFEFENNFYPPKKFPGWGFMNDKYQGKEDRTISVFFDVPEKMTAFELEMFARTPEKK